MQLQQTERQTSTSTSPEGERALWNMIWKANVPQKLKLLARNLHLKRLAFKFNAVKGIWKCCLLAHYVA
jgi:hypothetical protein